MPADDLMGIVKYRLLDAYQLMKDPEGRIEKSNPQRNQHLLSIRPIMVVRHELERLARQRREMAEEAEKFTRFERFLSNAHANQHGQTGKTRTRL
jgi:hypothetical protein